MRTSFMSHIDDDCPESLITSYIVFATNENKLCLSKN